jgi:7-keto-8-aminopelargonate synthetase-like enzyme
MDGDMAPLKELVELKNKYNCQLFIDEAHATGIFGKTGAGLVEREKLSDKVDLIMGTFSKALGSFGAYIACSRLMKNYLINTCRSFIYSTALPPAVIAANIAALEIVKSDEGKQRREQLLKHAEIFRNTLKFPSTVLGASSRNTIVGQTQIVPVIVGENKTAVELSNKLKEKGFWVLPIRYPTVPKGSARLRFCVNYGHTKEMLKALTLPSPQGIASPHPLTPLPGGEGR